MLGYFIEFRSDTNRMQVVDRERGDQLAKEYGIKFFETSAKNNENVTEVSLPFNQNNVSVSTRFIFVLILFLGFL